MSPDSPLIRFEREGDIAFVTLDRPERLTRVRNDLAAIEAVVGGERVA